MQINNLKSPNFTSNYKFLSSRENFNAAEDALDKLYGYENLDFQIYQKFLPPKTAFETGVFSKCYISADDSYDKQIEGLLAARKIDFKKIAFSETLAPNNIVSRIKLSKTQIGQNKKLVSLDTKKIDKLLRAEESFYVGHKGKGGIGTRYEKVGEYLKTGLDIEPTNLRLKEDNGKLTAIIEDGRHRFAYLRDLGISSMPFALDENSAQLAQKHGLTGA